MPASRWWEFEDGEVNFGKVEAGPADLARLLVAEFATAFGRDWFVVPVTVPVGSLTELERIDVLDAFGGLTPVSSTARADLDGAPDGNRAWRLFELSGDKIGDGHPSPWLFVPPSLVDSIHGSALEQVALTRDDAANLAWGIEHLVEGPSAGRLTGPRPATPHGPPHPPPPGVAPRLSQGRPSGTTGGGGTGSSPGPAMVDPIRPRAGGLARVGRDPPAPGRNAGVDAARCGAGRTQERPAGPQPPTRLYEEEVPRSGVRIERSWQLGRWRDGSLHGRCCVALTQGGPKP